MEIKVLHQCVVLKIQSNVIQFYHHFKNQKHKLFHNVPPIYDREDQSKLTNHNFKQNDLVLLMQHLYKKDQMSVSDRNLIRRILLTIFPEKLISAGGKKLIQYTRLINLEKGQKFQGNNTFYLIIKGQVKITSPFYTKKFTQGMYFGHLQLMTHMADDSFYFIPTNQTILIGINSNGFYTSLLQYFQSIYLPKCEVIPKIFSDKLEPIQILLLSDQMMRKQYKIGEKINKKGQIIKEIVFIEEGLLSQNMEKQSYHNKIDVGNTIGLKQIILGEETYFNSNFTIEQIKGYFIEVNKFMKIIGKEVLSQIREQNHLNNIIMQTFQSAILTRSKTEPCQIQVMRSKVSTEQEGMKNFIRVRKVNLSISKSKSLILDGGRQSSKSYKTLANKYEASFVFLKENSTPANDKSYRLNRMNSYKTQDMSPTKFYLENVEIPSLANYRKTSA